MKISDHTAIEKLKDQLVKHLNWGDPKQWHSAMFTELSEKIFEQC